MEPINSGESPKLFVGGLSLKTTQENLQNYCSRYGEITDCTVIKNKLNEHLGFGFVTFADLAHRSIFLDSGPHHLDGNVIQASPDIPWDFLPAKPKRLCDKSDVFLEGLIKASQQSERIKKVVPVDSETSVSSGANQNEVGKKSEYESIDLACEIVDFYNSDSNVHKVQGHPDRLSNTTSCPRSAEGSTLRIQGYQLSLPNPTPFQRIPKGFKLQIQGNPPRTPNATICLGPPNGPSPQVLGYPNRLPNPTPFQGLPKGLNPQIQGNPPSLPNATLCLGPPHGHSTLGYPNRFPNPTPFPGLPKDPNPQIQGYPPSMPQATPCSGPPNGPKLQSLGYSTCLHSLTQVKAHPMDPNQVQGPSPRLPYATPSPGPHDSRAPIKVLHIQGHPPNFPNATPYPGLPKGPSLLVYGNSTRLINATSRPRLGTGSAPQIESLCPTAFPNLQILRFSKAQHQTTLPQWNPSHLVEIRYGLNASDSRIAWSQPQSSFPPQSVPFHSQEIHTCVGNVSVGGTSDPSSLAVPQNNPTSIDKGFSGSTGLKQNTEMRGGETNERFPELAQGSGGEWQRKISHDSGVCGTENLKLV